MKSDIHPKNYRPVLFQDTNNKKTFLINSCVKTTETAKGKDGNEYPVYKMDISSASHPFYTKEQITVDAAGRIEKFNLKRKEMVKNEGVSSKKKERKRRTIEEKVNEALRADIEKDQKKDEKLMAKIKKNRKPEEMEAIAEAEEVAEIPVEETA